MNSWKRLVTILIPSAPGTATVVHIPVEKVLIGWFTIAEFMLCGQRNAWPTQWTKMCVKWIKKTTIHKKNQYIFILLKNSKLFLYFLHR